MVVGADADGGAPVGTSLAAGGSPASVVAPADAEAIVCKCAHTRARTIEQESLITLHHRLIAARLPLSMCLQHVGSRSLPRGCACVVVDVVHTATRVTPHFPSDHRIQIRLFEIKGGVPVGQWCIARSFPCSALCVVVDIIGSAKRVSAHLPSGLQWFRVGGIGRWNARRKCIARFIGRRSCTELTCAHKQTSPSAGRGGGCATNLGGRDGGVDPFDAPLVLPFDSDILVTPFSIPTHLCTYACCHKPLVGRVARLNICPLRVIFNSPTLS
jgi:hypothetical protein